MKREKRKEKKKICNNPKQKIKMRATKLHPEKSVNNNKFK